MKAARDLKSATEIAADRRPLAMAVAAAARVVERRNSIPILGNVKIVASGGRITVTATDLDMEIETWCDGEGEAEFTVPARTLSRLLSEAEGDSVRILYGDGRATFHVGRMAFTLSTLPVVDFPGPMSIEPMGRLDFPEATLPWLLAPVLPCISTEETRYYLNGVYLHRSADAIRAVATDGHRIALRDLRLDAPVPDIGMILPRGLFPHLLALAGQGEVAAEFSQVRCRFTTAGGRITTRAIDGTFPDYTRIFPAETPNTITIDRAAFARFIRCARAMGKRGTVKISDDLGSPRLSCIVDGSEIAETLPGSIPQGYSVAFNVKYLAAFLPHLGETVTIRGKSAGDPHAFDGTADGDRLLLMPMS